VGPLASLSHWGKALCVPTESPKRGSPGVKTPEDEWKGAGPTRESPLVCACLVDEMNVPQQ
jgi:hypothetical protein